MEQQSLSGTPAHLVREYETIYILRPDAGEEAAQKVASRIVETVDRLGGKLVEVQVWGRRRMAYTVRGHSKGVFLHIRYLGFPGVVEELERNFRMLDAILKYQTVKLRHEVDPSAVTVDPEQVKFAGMEFAEEPEEPEEGGDREGGDESFPDYEPEPSAPAADGAAAAEAPAEEKAEAPAEEKAEAPAEEKAEAPAEGEGSDEGKEG